MRLGDILVESGVIDAATRDKVLAEQKNTDKAFGRMLVEGGYCSENDIAQAISRQMGIRRVNPSDFTVDADVISLIPYSFAIEKAVLPLSKDGGSLTLAMANPLDIPTSDFVAIQTGLRVEPVVATEKEILEAIRHFYTLYGAGDALDLGAEATRVQAVGDLAPASVDLLREMGEQAPVVRLVNSLITRAVEKRATDIHLEPARHEVRVRFRVDGLLQHEMNIPKSLQLAVAARIKIMSELDIAERRRTQDGRMFVTMAGRDFDVRVSILPAQHGENIVLRLLDKTSALMTLEQLGFDPAELELLRNLASRPQGMLLVTGPTGSGKTTTLYALLNMLKDETTSIVTVEEPIEYELEGVVQTQVNPRIGVTFATQLRSILRQDPDVILVGEIRDLETAETSMQAALTGHLVLSTLHTNDAASSVVRLIDMGIQPYLVPSCLTGVIAQRLVRLICPNCKEPYQPTGPVLSNVRSLWGEEVDKITFYRGAGCKRCSGTGYLGRTALGEMLRFTPQLATATLEGATASELKSIAISQGMVTLQKRGMQKVAEGLTTPEEVLRVAFF